MATYQFSALTSGQSISFSPSADLLNFDQTAISAANLGVTLEGSNSRVTVLTGTDAGKNVVLLNTSPLQLATSNVAFANGSALLFGDNAVAQNDNANNMLNSTAGNDLMSGFGGNDTFNMVPASGTYGNDVVDGGAGTDTLDFSGATAKSGITVDLAAGTLSGGGTGGAGSATIANIESVVGTQFNDKITGNADGNYIYAWIGDDTLAGGAGVDTLGGAAGNDSFVFRETGAANADFITDFTSGADKIHLDASVMTALGASGNFTATDARFFAGTAAHDADDRVIYNSATHQLFYDPDGNGVQSAQLIATLQSGATLVATDIAVDNGGSGGGGGQVINGTAGNDSLVGGSGNDTLNGLGGNDTLVGNDGNDLLDGGAGDDSASGGNGNDVYRPADMSAPGHDVFDGGAGIDTLDLSNAHSRVTADLDEGVWSGGGDGGTGSGNTGTQTVENFVGGAFDDLVGGSPAANAIDGGGGNDTLWGVLGSDTLTGGTGADVFFYSESGPSNADVITDFVSGTDQIRLSTDTFTQLSAGRFSSGDIRFYAAAGATAGHDADDRVIYDTSTGKLYYDADGNGTGAAQLIATLQGAPALAATDISAGSSTSFGHVINGTSGNDSLVGTSGDDTLNGFDGNDTLNGAGGTDVLNGGAGNDTYLVDGGNPKPTIVDSSGIDTEIVTNPGNSFSLPDGLEELTLRGTNGHVLIDFPLFGNDSDNQINIQLDSGYTFVEVNGGGGNDTIVGGSGGEGFVLDANGGHDVVDGGVGFDLIILRSAGTVDFSTGTATAGAATMSFTNVESAYGSGFDDRLVADSGGRQLFGDGGNDTLVGGAGDDRLDGDGAFSDAPPDSITGDDVLTGNGGNDTLFGGRGNDTLDGGAGDDALNGGDGADTFRFSVAPGPANADGVNDFQTGVDKISLDASVMPALGAAGNFTADDPRFYAAPGASFAHDADDRVVYDTSTGQLYYVTGDGHLGTSSPIAVLSGHPALVASDIAVNGSGNQTLNGGPGDDSLTGGDGNDSISGFGGNDTLSGGVGQDTLDGGTGNDSLDGGEGSDLELGGDGDDTLVGGSFDTNTSAIDTLDGGAGNDRYVLERNIFLPSDVVLRDSGGIDTIESRGGDWTLGSGFENLTLFHDFPDDVSSTSGTGNELDNVITGFDAWWNHNSLDGADGNDTLIGGAGSDNFRFLAGSGNIGNDVVDGRDGIDTLDFAGARSAVTIDFRSDTASGGGNGGSGHVVFSNIERASGGPSNDLLIGNDGMQQTDTKSGFTTFAGPTLFGGDGNDTVLGGAAADELGGDFQVRPFGGFAPPAGDDVVHGGGGNDTIESSGGNDQLFGEAGDDTFYVIGSDGTNHVDGGDGSDTLQYTGAFTPVTVDLGAGTLMGGGPNAGSTTLVSIENFTGTVYADAITGTSGANIIDGAGGGDTIFGGAGDDLLYANNVNQGAFPLDTAAAQLSGEDGNDTLTGGFGADRLDGGAGNDSISGSSGNDTLIGGTGQDTLDGGSGINSYALNAAPGTANADQIIGFNPSQDLIRLDAAVMPALGAGDRFAMDDPRFYAAAGATGGHDADDRIVFDTTTKNLYYDADGNGAGAAQLLATFPGDIFLQAGDFVVDNGGVPFNQTINGTGGDDSLSGGAGNDTINGLGGNDTLIGNAGDDSLVGGAGTDRLDGGTGNDTLIPGFDSDTVDGGAGSDTLLLTGAQSAVNVDLVAGTMTGGDAAGTAHASLANIEFVDAGALAVSVNITGNGADNYLRGGAGVDVISGGAGNDTVYGSSFSNANGDVLLGGDGNDLVSAFSGNTSLDGGAGNDILAGGSGVDQFLFTAAPGVANADNLAFFEVGKDKIHLDATVMPALGTGGNLAAGDARFYAAVGAAGGHDADDRVVYDTSTGKLYYDADGNGGGTAQLIATLQDQPMLAATDIVVDHGASGQTINGTAGNDSLVGGPGNDTINGLAGNDTLIGGAGDDQLDGGTGTDSMDGGDGNDTYFVTAGDVLTDSSGIDTVVSPVDWTLAPGVFENLTLTGTAFDAEGNNLDNRIVGNDANNEINARAGNDTLLGMGGNDTFDFSTGGTSTYGSDVIDGGAGVDTIDFGGSNAQSAIVANLAAGTLSGGGAAGAGSAALTNIESVIGTQFNDLITGSAGDNYFYAWLGNDTVNGGAGNDTLNGSDGNDSLNGGAGVDFLTGGAGNDLFVFNQTPGAANADRITDFASGTDKLQLDNAVMTQLGADGNFVAGDARFFAAAGASGGHDADDRMIYNTSTGQLYYDDDGSGAHAAQLVATLQAGAALAATDLSVI